MKYAAFIRGVGPENPNMHGAKLKWFFEELGFKNVQTVISSGNVIFESDNLDQSFLEKYIEENLPKKLNFSRAVIIRNHDQLKKLFNSEPFNKTEDKPNSRLNVTFLKKGGEVFSIINPEVIGTTKIMSKLEKEHGKDITMRTWKTIGRILKKMK
jgi:uncharacterized protein (DUF1697 family)